MRSLLLTLFVCLLPLVAIAQESKRATLELAGTYVLPAGPEEFPDYWNAGFGVSGGINFPLSRTTRLSVVLDANRFSLDVGSGDATLIYGMANMSVLLGDRKLLQIAPYVFGGAGVYRQWVSDEVRSGSGGLLSDSETAFGLNVGLGLEMPVGPQANFFLDGRYVVGLTGDDPIQLMPIRFGVRTN